MFKIKSYKIILFESKIAIFLYFLELTSIKKYAVSRKLLKILFNNLSKTEFETSLFYC